MQRGVTPNPYPTPIDPSALKFGDRIDNKATVVGTFESSDLGTVVFAVLDSAYYGQHNWASGLNDHRPKLEKIFRDKKATRLIVEHAD